MKLLSRCFVSSSAAFLLVLALMTARNASAQGPAGAGLSAAKARPAVATGLQVVSPPQDQTVAVGKKVSFSVIASGPATLPKTYQWYKDNAALANATKATYTIPKVTVASQGSYWVVVQNSVDTVVSDQATLTVVVPAIIVTQPHSQAKVAGDSVSFSVVANGLHLHYQWRKGGKPISGATQPEYDLNSVTAADAGVYSVVVSNEAGNVTSASATLTVAVLPGIAAQPRGLTVKQGQTVIFAVVGSGTAPLSYQWLKDGTNITGANRASLIIPKAQAANAGVYTVQVSNAYGEADSVGAALVVNSLPAILEQPQTRVVNQGSSVLFSVAAASLPPTSPQAQTYQWRKNGTGIKGATSATYAVASVQTGDAGAYSVVVRNSVGSTTSDSASLIVHSAGINGSWHLVQYQTPILVSLLPAGDNQSLDLQGGGEFKTTSGSLTFKADGTLAGVLDTPFKGIYTYGGNGLVELTETNSQTQIIPLNIFVNAAHDFMATLYAEGTGGNGRQSLYLFVRPPTSYSVSQLAGAWNVVNFQTPAQMTFNQNSQSANLNGGDAFKAATGTLTITANGTVSGVFDEAFIGRITAGAQGMVTANINGPNGIEPHTLLVNASKNVLVLVETKLDPENNHQQVIVFERAPLAVTSAEIAGRWNITQLRTPDQIILGQDFLLDGGAGFGTVEGSVTINADGSAVGELEGGFTGAFLPVASTNLNGFNIDATIVTTNNGETGSDTVSQHFAFFINAGKDIMTLTDSQLDANDNHQELLILQRAPVNGLGGAAAATPPEISVEVPVTMTSSGAGEEMISAGFLPPISVSPIRSGNP